MDNDKASDTRLNERFVRWQEALRQTLGSHVTLIVALSSGGLGFVGSLLASKDTKLEGGAGGLLIAAGAFFLLSLAAALFISWNRLRDVRATLEILRSRREEATQNVIDKLTVQTRALGDKTWDAIYLQLGLFGTGAILFGVGVAIAFAHRI